MFAYYPELHLHAFTLIYPHRWNINKAWNKSTISVEIGKRTYPCHPLQHPLQPSGPHQTQSCSRPGGRRTADHLDILTKRFPSLHQWIQLRRTVQCNRCTEDAAASLKPPAPEDVHSIGGRAPHGGVWTAGRRRRSTRGQLLPAIRLQRWSLWTFSAQGTGRVKGSDMHSVVTESWSDLNVRHMY